MTERTWIDLEIWDHPVFREQPFSEREAYIWLMQRGSTIAMPRYLARLWQWAPTRVRKYLQKMNGAGLIKYEAKKIRAVALDEAIPLADPRHWQELRSAVFARDRFSCVYCGSGDDLACDHIFPRSKGGADRMDNLATACRSCNSSKRDKLLHEWRQ